MGYTYVLGYSFCFFLLLCSFVEAGHFTCEIRTACLGNETLLLRLNASEGMAPNNTHAQLANFSGSAYPYSVCCGTDAFRTMENECGGDFTAVVNLEANTSSHVEAGSQSNYNYAACLNVTQGNITCEYPSGSCGAEFNSVISISSSEAGDNNLTNAHVAAPGFYDRQVCCRIGGQNPPTVAFVDLSPINATTRDDLFCDNGAATDPDGDSVTLHYNWYVNQTSITVLNLPMDFAAGTTHDISGFANHGAVASAVSFLPSGGEVGGGFDMPGSAAANISVGNDSSLNVEQAISVALWFNPDVDDVTEYMFAKGNGSLVSYAIRRNTAEQIVFTIYDSTGAERASVYRDVPVSASGGWYHVVGTYNGSQQITYVNGVAGDIQASWSDTILVTTDAAVLGTRKGTTQEFDGQLDEAMVFNRSLSADEVVTLYNLNNRYLNGTELQRNDTWNCSITPVDSTGINGSTVFSNQTFVAGSLPLPVTLLYPAHGNASVFERIVNFNWTDADERDGDVVTYTFNLSVEAGACAVETEQTDIADSNFTFGELCTDQVYYWNVTACDNMEGCSSVSSTFNFTISSICSLILINNNTDFGALTLNQMISTDDYAVEPFLLENAGNVHLNITLNATGGPLYATVGLNDPSFQFRAEENESTSFNVSGSQTTYTNMPDVFTHVITELNHTDSADVAAVHINLTVPGSETAGTKETDIIFRGVAS